MNTLKEFAPIRRIHLLWQGLWVVLFAMAALVALTGSTDRFAGAEAEALRTVTNNAFKKGEKLTFAVKYKFVTAGYAVMSVGSTTETVSGRPTYPVKFTVRTTDSFDKIFKVRDTYQTWIDTDGLFPWKFTQKVREGSYSKDFSANIDQKEKSARTTAGTFKTPAYVQDVLSAFYYARAHDYSSMKKNESFTLKNFYGKKTHTLKVKYLGKETITVDAGTFKCIKVEPMVKEGGLFKSEGKIYLWMTDDKNHMPVKVKAKVAVGSIDSELTKYSGLKNDLTSKTK